MCTCTRRGLLGIGVGVAILARPARPHAQPLQQVDDATRRHFIAEAERMREQAVKAGDQSYGAVLVRGHAIVGWGPSRVVTDRNPDAHAERVAIWDAQARLGTSDLAGTVLYSTSRPCGACEFAAAAARVSRMYWGKAGTDAGAPRR